MSATYEKVNSAWKTTCLAVLGGEIGELKEFEPWLKEYLTPVQRASSHLSGKEITLTSSNYCPGAKFLSFDEVDFKKPFTPLSINEIKDIDSLVEAVQERIYYTGNVVLGNSQLVESSSDVLDGVYIGNCSVLSNSKYAAFSNRFRDSSYLFGIFEVGATNHAIRSIVLNQSSRCFESFFVVDSQDTYYSAKLISCSDCLFSFGAVGKRYAIGNRALPEGKYLPIKEKLLAEIREQLKKEKRIFSIFDLVGAASKHQITIKVVAPKAKEGDDKRPIEQAFTAASSVVLGKELKGIDQYEKFLQKHVPDIPVVKSALSGETVYTFGTISRFLDTPGIRKRIVTEEEMLKIGELAVAEKKLENISLDMDRLSGILSDVAFVTFDVIVGQNINPIHCAVLRDTENCYKVHGTPAAKLCAYSYGPHFTECAFGCGILYNSSFCFKSAYSKKIARCFEVDSSETCTDLYYAHNCENVHDSMFCFNVKNLRNAIGNAPLPPEKYEGLKKSLLEQLVAELEKKKDLRWDIYNVGCGPAPLGLSRKSR